jgi:hypothetical protein
VELWLSLASLLLALIAAEFAARKFLPEPARVILLPNAMDNGLAMRSVHQSDPLLGWTLKPGPMQYRHILKDNRGVVQYDVLYSVVDGHPRTSAHPPDGPVVIAAGASFTFGHALNDEDSWPWMLQQRLPHHPVVNTADMGYGTDQALLSAERQVNRRPGSTAAVILGFDDSQIEPVRSSQGWLVFLYPFSKPMFAIGPDGDPVYKRQVRIWSPPILSDYSDLFAHAMNIAANRFYGIGSHEQARTLTASLIRTYARRFQQSGIRMAVVILPYADDQTPQSRADRQFIVDNLREAHIPTLILDFPRLPDGRFDVKTFAVSTIDRHPNRKYNNVLVEQLWPFLQSNGIVAE